MSAQGSNLSEARLQIAPADANRVSMALLALGVAGLGASGYAIFAGGDKLTALTSYLVAFMFVATVGVGCMFFAMLQHLVGARWSVAIRRIAENFGAPLWLLIPLFIPIALNVPTLFHEWAGPGPLEEIVKAKVAYLNQPFFFIRAAFYLVSWAVLGYVVYKRSVELDKDGDPNLVLRLRRMAPPGVLVFGVTLTFAGFDWMMSLDPTWASTMFGVYTFAGTFLSALSTVALTGRLLHQFGYLKGVVNEEHFHDIGKFMFGFIVFWAYIAFSQFFLIWYANIPEETLWFRKHWTYEDHDWSTVGWALIGLQFLLPFFAILSRHAKRNAAIMIPVAALLIVMHYVDLFWVVMPLFRKVASFEWTDAAALCGVAGIYLGLVVRTFGAAPLVPVKDPFLPDSLEYDNG
jgi:hypothetical protein